MSTEAVERPAEEREAQLAWERRWAPWAAAAAFAAGVALLAGQILSPRVDAAPARRTSALLLEIDGSPARALGAALAVALGNALLGAVLFYLYRATAFRRPQTLAATRVLVLLGAVFGSVAWLGFQVVQLVLADDFASAGPRTEARADELLGQVAPQLVGALSAAGVLSLAFAVVLVSVNAMRAGLLSRFMGFLGAFAGVMLIIPFFLALPTAWLIALGMLILGRWPGGGRGPAWETGNPDPWPTPIDRREQFEAQRAAREAGLVEDRPGDEEGAGPPPAAAGAATTDPDTPVPSAGASAERTPAKRKRKRRRR